MIYARAYATNYNCTAHRYLEGREFFNGAVSGAFSYLFGGGTHRQTQEDPAQTIADRALADGHLKLAEANAIWRANNDPDLKLTVDAGKLAVKQIGDFRSDDRASGEVQGADWFVHGKVTLRQVDGNIEIRPGPYDFLPHDVSRYRPELLGIARNIKTYGGFYVGSLAGTSVGTDFLIRYEGQPRVVR